MNKPDFSKINLDLHSTKCTYADWVKKLKDVTNQHDESFVSESMEKIVIKPLYCKNDIKDFEHIDYLSGMPPYLRGPYTTMYVIRPWTIRQYAGFSTAEESNAFYRRNLAAGQ
ncbi:MAG: methylmalonyl-CoA mutase, partial [Ignavibacteriales bacterium]|nr:methylmalonyl-CoA mutase [Ignavibacteriales bacterium]